MTPEQLKDILNVLTNVAQLFDGWHNDGTTWSEWDESVRKDVSRVQTEILWELDGNITRNEVINKNFWPDTVARTEKGTQ